MNTNRKTFVIYGGIAGAAAIVLMAALSIFSLNPRNSDLSAIAGGNPCVSIEEARQQTKFTLPDAPHVLGSRILRCIEPEQHKVNFIYAAAPLSATDLSPEAMNKDNTLLMIVGDPTYGGVSSFDAQSIFNHNYQAAQSQRPDLKPQLVQINGHLAWGREGGDNAGRVVVEDANHTEISRSTEPVPAMLEMEKGENNLLYHFEAFAPLSELIGDAKTLG